MARQLTIDDYLKYQQYDEMANKWTAKAERLRKRTPKPKR